MGIRENLNIVNRLVVEVWAQGNTSIIYELLSPEYIYHSPTGEDIKGPEAFKDMVKSIRSAIPDRIVTVENYIGEGDELAIQFSSRGTFLGNLQDIKPTGKSYITRFAIFYRFSEGKIIEEIEYSRQPTFEEQVGI
ncbi:ester cyclase [Chloroflexota bacterium]